MDIRCKNYGYFMRKLRRRAKVNPDPIKPNLLRGSVRRALECGAKDYREQYAGVPSSLFLMDFKNRVNRQNF
jgi:hypothetical protein